MRNTAKHEEDGERKEHWKLEEREHFQDAPSPNARSEVNRNHPNQSHQQLHGPSDRRYGDAVEQDLQHGEDLSSPSRPTTLLNLLGSSGNACSNYLWCFTGGASMLRVALAGASLTSRAL